MRWPLSWRVNHLTLNWLKYTYQSSKDMPSLGEDDDAKKNCTADLWFQLRKWKMEHLMMHQKCLRANRMTRFENRICQFGFTKFHSGNTHVRSINVSGRKPYKPAVKNEGILPTIPNTLEPHYIALNTAFILGHHKIVSWKTSIFSSHVRTWFIMVLLVFSFCLCSTALLKP